MAGGSRVGINEELKKKSPHRGEGFQNRPTMQLDLYRAAGLREGQQPLGLFVPKVQPRIGKAFADGHPIALSQCRVVAQHFGQTIEGDTAVEVVHMVDADVCTQPLQRAWQDVMRRAVEGRIMQVPRLILFPMRGLELVLHIEQPHARRRSQKGAWHKDQQDRHDPPEVEDHRQSRKDRQIGAHRAQPIARLGHQPQWQAVLQEEEIARP